jgi:hypothetical protein
MPFEPDFLGDEERPGVGISRPELSEMVDRRATEIVGFLQQRFLHFPPWARAIVFRAIGIKLIRVAAGCEAVSGDRQAEQSG